MKIKNWICLFSLILLTVGCTSNSESAPHPDNKLSLIPVTIQITDMQGKPVFTSFILKYKELPPGEVQQPPARQTDANGQFKKDLIEGKTYIVEVYSKKGTVKKEFTVISNMKPIVIQVDQ